jgi:Transglycosylase SLT domain
MTGTQCGGFEVDDVALAGLAEAWAQGGAQVAQVAQALTGLLGRVRALDVGAASCPVTAQLAVRDTAAALAGAEQTASALAVALGSDAAGVAQCARNYQDADNCVKHHIDTVAPSPAPAPPPAPVPAPTRSSDPEGPGSSEQVQEWIGQAFALLETSGVPADELDQIGVQLIIEHESGGNPTAVNRWDSNWLEGHPSKGLMQCIDSTFDEYRLPGHDDIFNPVDNIIAGVRYAISRYGSIENVPGVRAVESGGQYVGY